MSSCKKCDQPFTGIEGERSPQMLKCGHSMCIMCTSDRSPEGYLQCPECWKYFNQAAELRPNYSLLDMMAEARCIQHNDSSWVHRCASHVCITCKLLVCHECTRSAAHKHHGIEKIDEIEQQHRRQLIEVRARLLDIIEELENNLESTARGENLEISSTEREKMKKYFYMTFNRHHIPLLQEREELQKLDRCLRSFENMAQRRCAELTSTISKAKELLETTLELIKLPRNQIALQNEPIADLSNKVYYGFRGLHLLRPYPTIGDFFPTYDEDDGQLCLRQLMKVRATDYYGNTLRAPFVGFLRSLWNAHEISEPNGPLVFVVDLNKNLTQITFVDHNSETVDVFMDFKITREDEEELWVELYSELHGNVSIIRCDESESNHESASEAYEELLDTVSEMSSAAVQVPYAIGSTGPDL